MQVIATAVGIDGQGHRREIGDKFQCPKNAQGQEIVKASWYKQVPEQPQQEQRKGNKLVEE